MRLIMLCGQSNSGKSTYGSWLSQQLNNSYLLRVDDIVKRHETCNFNHINQFAIKINDLLQNNTYETLILDFSHDTQGIRTFILEIALQGISCFNIDFYTIFLRPPVEKIELWGYERYIGGIQSRVSLANQRYTDEFKEIIRRQYYSAEYPTPEEFKHYNFKSTTHIIIDNSKSYEKLF